MNTGDIQAPGAASLPRAEEELTIIVERGILRASAPLCDKCRVYPDKFCSCAPLRKKARLFTNLNLPARFRHATMESIRSYSPLNQPLRPLYQWIEAWSRRNPLPTEGILVSGPCGIGKTHALVALLRHLTLSRSVPCLFLDWNRFLQKLKSAYEGNDSTSDCFLAIHDTEVLLLDDLGASRGTEWEIFMLDEVISIRYNALLPTFITTNLRIGEGESRSEIEKVFLHHTTSRLAELCHRISLAGDDRRGVGLRQLVIRD